MWKEMNVLLRYMQKKKMMILKERLDTLRKVQLMELGELVSKDGRSGRLNGEVVS